MMALSPAARPCTALPRRFSSGPKIVRSPCSAWFSVLVLDLRLELCSLATAPFRALSPRLVHGHIGSPSIAVRSSRGGTELHKNSFLSSGVAASEQGFAFASFHGERFMLPDYPKPPFPSQKQPMPGSTDAMQPRPDHGEKSYKGSGRLKGLKAVITGGDSGIGRAVAIAYAREGADVLIAFLNETDEANEVKKLVEKEGRKAVLVPGDLKDARHCREVIKRAVDDLGGLDILVNNAAHQATFKDIGDISDDEWEMTFQTNIHAMFYLTKAAVPHMKPGSSIINTASVNADMPNPILLAYATTKGAIQNFTGGLAQMLAEKGIRANAVAPGPIWTPLIPSTMPDDAVKNFGKQVPMQRPGQPAELATAYVMLADPMSSYVSGTTVAVTGGKPFI
jgi:NAD(P)-dependent dehydrogenase (short-subunit alcohol dehydrogenase family)